MRLTLAPAGSRPNVILGSHDPLLEWALRESRSGLATYFDGSADGLKRFEAGEGLAAGLHLYDADADDWNTPAMLGACSRLPAVLIEWARRRRGLIVRPGLEGDIRTIADLAGHTFAARQARLTVGRDTSSTSATSGLERGTALPITTRSTSRGTRSASYPRRTGMSYSSSSVDIGGYRSVSTPETAGPKSCSSAPSGGVAVPPNQPQTGEGKQSQQAEHE